ncbi:MAG: haloacid dehalogenase type II [Usitatibacter sp.]
MTARPTLVTFDAYTALLDCERGLVAALEALAPANERQPLARAWRAKQLEYAQLSNSLARERIPFRVITRRALDYTLARAGVGASDAQRTALEAAWDHLPPWPEAKATLSTLAARGYRLAILSNGDLEMLRALVRGWDVPLELLGCDQAGHYKPHPSVYALPQKVLGVAPAQVLHVAGSANDVLGAKLAGLRCAWSNRGGDRVIDPEVRADYEMRDLAGLLEILPG